MKRKFYSFVVLLLMGASVASYADVRPYVFELGVQAGVGYYVGDATPHIFQDVREAYGLQFRYKFTNRWAVQAKISGQRIAGDDYDKRGKKLLDNKGNVVRWGNQLLNFDAVAEFNFLPFGLRSRGSLGYYSYTPYIFLGLGAGLYNDIVEKGDFKLAASGYLPIGIGFKWQFIEWGGLNVAWQHNIYVADDLESRKSLDNRYNMNGSNIMNCDITGQLTAGIVFEFGHAPKPCRICNAEDGY